MRRNRGAALANLMEDLGNGDPLAWGIVIGGLVILAGFGIAILVVRKKLKQDDDNFANRHR